MFVVGAITIVALIAQATIGGDVLGWLSIAALVCLVLVRGSRQMWPGQGDDT